MNGKFLFTSDAQLNILTLGWQTSKFMIQNSGTLFNGCEKGVDVSMLTELAYFNIDVSMPWNRQLGVIFLQEQT